MKWIPGVVIWSLVAAGFVALWWQAREPPEPCTEMCLELEC